MLMKEYKPLERLLISTILKLPLMITCREFEKFIVDYLDDQLSRKQKTVFELHLRMCADCRAYLEAYRRSIQLGQTVFTEPGQAVPEEVPEELIKAILLARKSN